MNYFKVSAEKSIKTSDLLGKTDIATRKWGFTKQINEIYFKFPWITRIWKKKKKKKDSWEEVSQTLVGLLAARLNLDCFELNKQISIAHRTLKSEDNNNYWPIFAQVVSWRLEENSFNSMQQECWKSVFHILFQKN